ncbi:LLM class flavin-dependent oxidoreductase [Amycolatopsis australiensis]|uniref:5,10-methylenetetrahydromethanopterin reductase n=1 Tax=Amycolatopsis australiensis TaxID=546364 RepID=A0A1K1S2M2_9PSEU|nr:LLM class flavin-dependent oxidoreductase [Amycolatopsis australiensis]SFW78603.1 5,10-methylenetetrahydromethanopterin reductase [Amycolatopsis australiensis]
MRIGVRVPPCVPVPEVVAFVREAERLGFDDVWFPDSQLLWRDVFATAAAAAAGTSRIGLGTAVTNVVTRHPSVVAGAARTVAELAPGRFVLGVGVGNSSVVPAGLAPSTRTGLRAGLDVIRSLLAGAEVEFGGVRSRLRDPVAVPLHLAASGPRNLRLAGEAADGAILLSGVAPEPLQAALRQVAAGAAGRDPVPITVSAFCRVTDSVRRDARELKPVCSSIAANGGAAFLAEAGIRVRVPERWPELRPDLLHAESWEAAIRACESGVDDDAAEAFARRFCLFGTADEIAARLTELSRSGVSAVLLQHVGSYDLPRQLITDFAGRVLPVLRR